jgi:hypothetical protein
MSTWLNEHEIDNAVRQFSDHPVLGPAARYLSDYRDLINANSDGWPYWNAGTNPAGNLSRLIADARMAEYGVGRTIYVEPTLKDVLAAITPIKSFITRYNNKYAQSTKPALVLPVFLLVEISRYDGTAWFGFHDTKEDAADYHFNQQECPEDWKWDKLVDLDNGDVYTEMDFIEVTTTTTFGNPSSNVLHELFDEGTVE